MATEPRVEPRVEPSDPELYRLVRAVVRDGRERVLALRRDHDWRGSYRNFPELDRFDSGWPYLRRDSLMRVVDYGSAFGPKPDRHTRLIAYADLPSFAPLFAYVEDREDVRARFFPSARRTASGELPRLFTVLIADLPTSLIDRYTHLYGEDVELEDERLLPLYLERETAVLVDPLPAEVLVPVALTGFDASGRVELDTDVWLEELDDDTQRARALDSLAGFPRTAVAGAATHALVIGGCERPNPPGAALLGRDNWYPEDTVERFFHALRIVTGVDTGYAQVVTRPLGWADGYTATLPPLLSGPTLRRYPNRFDDGAWLRTATPVTARQVEKTAEVFRKLAGADERVRLASRRLSLAMLRDSEEDGILDACIGLEALLGDESTTEMTHKLALRLAAVSAVGARLRVPPAVVFATTKKLYGYRSAVGHGSRTAERKRIVTVDGVGDWPATTVATLYLRTALHALLDRPELVDPARIDHDLLLGGPTRDWKGATLDDSDDAQSSAVGSP